MSSFLSLFNPEHRAKFLQNATSRRGQLWCFLQGIHACLKEMKGKPANRRKKHQSGDEPGGCHKNPLTTHAQYGLMRPVARIAQSVEQGIENPCVLGSIPSPGTIFKETRLWRVFCFLRYGLSIELRSIIRLILRLTPAGSAQALLKDAARLCPSPGTLFKETRLWRVFCFLMESTTHAFRHPRVRTFSISTITNSATPISNPMIQ